MTGSSSMSSTFSFGASATFLEGDALEGAASGVEFRLFSSAAAFSFSRLAASRACFLTSLQGDESIPLSRSCFQKSQ